MGSSPFPVILFLMVLVLTGLQYKELVLCLLSGIVPKQFFGESTVLSKEMQDLEKRQNKDNETLHVTHCALQRKD